MRNKKEKVIIFLLGLGLLVCSLVCKYFISLTKHTNSVYFNDIYSYRVLYGSMYEVDISDGESLDTDLPNEFIIEPGIYQIDGKLFDMRVNGLYRFITKENRQIQRVVWNNDNINDLMSALAWCQVHTIGVKGLSPQEYDENVKSDVLYSTCGACADWIKYECENIGVECRVVAGLTLDEWNGYDNGHTLNEVAWDCDGDGEKEWICYDIDNNCMFSCDEGILNFRELVSAIGNKADYQIIEIAYDPRGISFNSDHYFSFSFFAEKINGENNLRKWYDRVFQVCLIQGEDKLYYFCDKINREMIENYSNCYKYIDDRVFINKFY